MMSTLISRVAGLAAVAFIAATLAVPEGLCEELGERLQRLEKQELEETTRLQARVERLLARINDPDRKKRRRAVYELAYFHADDPLIIERLLNMLVADNDQELSVEGRINAMHILLETSTDTWSSELIALGQSTLERIKDRYLASAGPQTREYIERLTEHIPSARPAEVQAVEFGVIQERTLETEAFTDVDIFVCPQTAADADTFKAAHSLGRLLAERDFGQVRLREKTQRMGLDFEGANEHTTVIYDAKHPEAKQVALIERAVEEIGGLPPFQARPNPGSASYWYLSVIVCRE